MAALRDDASRRAPRPRSRYERGDVRDRGSTARRRRVRAALARARPELHGVELRAAADAEAAPARRSRSTRPTSSFLGSTDGARCVRHARQRLRRRCSGAASTPTDATTPSTGIAAARRRQREDAVRGDRGGRGVAALEPHRSRTTSTRSRRRPGIPPLVWFVTQGKEGYCQHYAGAMALMLRSLGIPSRVAAGFVSGKYNASKKHGR